MRIRALLAVLAVALVIAVLEVITLEGRRQEPTPSPEESEVPRHPSPTKEAPEPERSWNLLAEGTMAVVLVERALYEREDLEHFYVCLRVEPREGLTLNVSLDSERSGFRPNQWGVQDEPRRGGINEMRVNLRMVGILDGEVLEQMRTRFLAGGWPRVGGDGAPAALEYFRAFNASTPADVRAREGPYFILSLDGTLTVTDGDRFELLAVTGDFYEQFDLVLQRPLTWKTLPAGDGILESRARADRATRVVDPRPAYWAASGLLGPAGDRPGR